jgi:hypothetical protein
MSLEDLGNIGEFVAAVAVVVSLIFLAVQIRQNTSAVRTASWQETVSGFRSANRIWLEPGVARAYAKGVRVYPDMPFDDRTLFLNVIADQALAFQGAFALYESGQLQEETYQAYLDWFASNVATPGGRAWWDEIGRPIHVKSMVEAVDARLSQGNLHDILTLGFARLDEAAPAQA